MLSPAQISVILAGLCFASAQTSTSPPHTATDTSAIAEELATSIPQSPVSHVKGKVFDRFVNIMLENVDFDIAASDRGSLLQYAGLTLTEYSKHESIGEERYYAYQFLRKHPPESAELCRSSGR